MEQYFRQITPNTGPFDLDVIVGACGPLFEKVGPAVFVTHSQGGGIGWLTAIRTPGVAAIVSYEAGTNFVFPESEVPLPLPSSGGLLEALGVPMADFLRLTRIPIVIFYGDYIPDQPSPNPGQDLWRVRMAMARLWSEVINRYGGDATVIHLPAAGLHGNTHLPFSDLNNLIVADLLSSWLTEKGLD